MKLKCCRISVLQNTASFLIAADVILLLINWRNNASLSHLLTTEAVTLFAVCLIPLWPLHVQLYVYRNQQTIHSLRFYMISSSILLTSLIILIHQISKLNDTVLIYSPNEYYVWSLYLPALCCLSSLPGAALYYYKHRIEPAKAYIASNQRYNWIIGTGIITKLIGELFAFNDVPIAGGISTIILVACTGAYLSLAELAPRLSIILLIASTLPFLWIVGGLYFMLFYTGYIDKPLKPASNEPSKLTS